MKYNWIILNNKCTELIDPFSLYRKNIFEIYKNENCFSFKIQYFFSKVLKKLKIFPDIPQSLYWNINWKIKIKKNKNWIIFYDSPNCNLICSFIKEKNQNAKIYIYSWDIHHIPKSNNLYNGVGSFDPQIAKENSINFYSQFYSYNEKCISLINKTKYHFNSDYSFIFVGLEKNRKQAILSIKELCDSISENSFFRIVDSSYTNSISYISYLSIVLRSKCIIDIVQDGQSGLSLRPMEALFFNKKLITNNKYIKETAFYCPENVFIYGEDNDLKNFMDKPLKIIPESIKSEYLLESFVDKIITK